jgi:hypothetical protein
VRKGEPVPQPGRKRGPSKTPLGLKIHDLERRALNLSKLIAVLENERALVIGELSELKRRRVDEESS